MEANNRIQPQRRQLCAGVHPCFSPHQIFLLKYCPKYCKRLVIPGNSENFGIISSKIKKIKMLEKLDSLFESRPKKGVVLELLKNKRRHVKFLPSKMDSFLRYFPNRTNFYLRMNTKAELKRLMLSNGLKSLTLTDRENSPNTSHLKLFPWQFWDHLKRLRLLENLSILLFGILDEALYDLLKKLDSYIHLNTDVKYIHLNIAFSKWEATSEEEWNFPNLFERVTNLEVHNTHYFQTLLLPKAKQLINITHLVLRLADPTQPFIEFSSLEAIGDIPSLLSVDLRLCLHSANNLKKFLIYTNFPPSIKSITLQLVDIDWSSLIPDLENQNFDGENPFEKDETCTTFYEKWSHLKSLESLDFSFTLADRRSISSGLFLMPILRNLSKLTRISYYHENSQFETKKRTLVFAKLLGAISHLKSTLRVLEIDDPLISLENLNPNNIPPLSLQVLYFNGYIIGDSKIHLLAKFFSKIDKKNGLHENNELRLGKIMIQNNESFASFLSNLVKFAKRDVTIKASIDVRNVSKDFFNRCLLDFVRKGDRIPNLLLEIVKARREDVNRNELKILLCKHHTFKSLQLESNREDVFFYFISNKHKPGSQINELRKEGLLSENESDGEEEEEENSLGLGSSEFSDDYDYIDSGSDYCKFTYTDDDGIEFFSESMSNVYRKISD